MSDSVVINGVEFKSIIHSAFAYDFARPVLYLANGRSYLGAVMQIPKQPLIEKPPPLPVITPLPTAQAPNVPQSMNQLKINANQIKPGEVIPVQYGRVLCCPDMVSVNTIDVTAESTLNYYLFCIGQGSYSVEAIKVGDTAIADIPGVTYEIVAPGQNVTLFPTAINAAPSTENVHITNTPQTFIVCDVGKTVDKIVINLAFKSGLFNADLNANLTSKSVTFTFEAIEINSSDVEVGSWVTLGTQTATAAQVEPYYVSYSYTVTAKRYKVRISRTTADDTDPRKKDAAHLIRVMSQRTNHPSYGDVTLLAVKITTQNIPFDLANNNLSVIATRKLATWNGSAWTALTATRSPIWAMCDVVKASYGARLTDSFLDLAALKTIDDALSARGDYFDARFTSINGVLDVLNTIGKMCRCQAYLFDGLINIVRKATTSSFKGLFTPSNILKGSFAVQYAPFDYGDYDYIIAEYVDSSTWQISDVICAMATQVKPLRVQIFGITNREQAYREGMFLLAQHFYGRVTVSFKTGLEGLIPMPNDVILVGHDVLDFCQWGEIYTTSGSTITLSNAVNFAGASSGVVYLSTANGGVTSALACTAGATVYELVLTAGLPSGIATLLSGAQEPTRYTFMTATSVAKRVRVSKIENSERDVFGITGVVEDDRVFTADTGSAPSAPAQDWVLPTTNAQPGDTTASGGGLSFSGLTVTSETGWLPKYNCTWSGTGYTGFVVEGRATGGGWIKVNTVTVNYCQIMLGNAYSFAEIKVTPVLNGIPDTAKALTATPSALASATLPVVSGINFYK